MKKVSCIVLLVLALSFSMIALSGCDNNTNSEDGSADASTDGTAAKTYELQLATEAIPETLFYERVVSFAEKIEERTDGVVTFTVYPADQLGDYSVVYEEIMKGNIDCTINILPSTYNPMVDITYLYYLAESSDQINYYYGKDSYVYNMIDEINEECGIKFLGFDFLGFGGLAFAKEPANVTVPGAPKDVTMRCPNSEIARLLMENMGYNVVTVSWGDIFTSLQTGIVDGFMGGTASNDYMSFRDVIKYYYQSNELMLLYSILFNMELWDSFTPEIQEIIMQVAEEDLQQSIMDSDADEQKYREMLDDYGVEVVMFSSEELSAIADYTRKNIWPLYEDIFSKEVLDALRQEAENYQGN